MVFCGLLNFGALPWFVFGVLQIVAYVYGVRSGRWRFCVLMMGCLAGLASVTALLLAIGPIRPSPYL
jgi:hypothetical protein